jgi:hypothetical protein
MLHRCQECMVLTYLCSGHVHTYPGNLAKIFCLNVDTYKVGIYIISDQVERVSHEMKKNTSSQRMWLACF